jgi:uridine kinase
LGSAPSPASPDIHAGPEVQIVPSLSGVVMYHVGGLSGTGKSTLYAELVRRGNHAVDADAVFGYFADPVTRLPSKFERRANWMWDTQKLRKFAHTPHDASVFICGGAMNENEFVNLFSKRFMLYIDSDTMRERLLARTSNLFGKDAEEMAEQLELNMSTVGYANRIGSIVIDATRPIMEVADDIVRNTL